MDVTKDFMETNVIQVCSKKGKAMMGKKNIIYIFFLPACPPGWYGRNCSYECGPNCIPSCDKFEGDCKLGCKPGWKGSYCDTSNVFKIDIHFMCNSLSYGFISQ